MKSYDYPVIIKPDISGGYVISCPTFQGCYSQGETVDEALKNIKEVIELCIEELIDEGLGVPSPLDLIVQKVAVDYDA